MILEPAMKKLLILCSLLSLLGANGQKNIYQSPQFDALSRDHRVLAILPFLTRLDLGEQLTAGEKDRLEQKEGYAVQDALQTYFGRGSKSRKFTVAFQDSKETNALLERNGISYAEIDRHTVAELARLLGVDGIVSGNMDVNILLSNGVPQEVGLLDYFIGEADYGRIGIKISDGASGKLLWKYEHEINRKSGKNTEDLIDKMMKKAARKFPYDKENRRKAE